MDLGAVRVVLNVGGSLTELIWHPNVDLSEPVSSCQTTTGPSCPLLSSSLLFFASLKPPPPDSTAGLRWLWSGSGPPVGTRSVPLLLTVGLGAVLDVCERNSPSEVVLLDAAVAPLRRRGVAAVPPRARNVHADHVPEVPLQRSPVVVGRP